MLTRLRGVGVSLLTVYETFRISIPTVVDSVRDGAVPLSRSDERLADWSRRILSHADIKLTVAGQSNAVTPSVVMSNHQSHFDVPSLYQAWPDRLRMVAKAELFRVPVFSQAMTAAGFIEIDRSNRERAIESLRLARKRLDEGISVWIAPEGTRSTTGELGPFKKGGFVLALEAHLPIVPVAIWGTRDVLPAHRMSATRGQRVHIEILPAIAPPADGDTSSASRDALMTEVRAAIARGVVTARARLAAERASG